MEDTPQPELVRRLLEPAAYPHATGGIRLVETHISWVFLTGPFAYKVKKPVSLGFLDFTTLENRHRFCEEEVRVSGRFAPAIYVGAVPITGSERVPRVDGTGTVIEWAVKLVQFDESDRLDARFEQGRLTATDCATLGEEIARVHEALPATGTARGLADCGARLPYDAASADHGKPAPLRRSVPRNKGVDDVPHGQPGAPESVQQAVAAMCGLLRERIPDAAARVDRIERWIVNRLDEARDAIAARIGAGRVRECHGDLHLANIVLHEGRMTAFDAIEFSPALRWIDVANDVAFLAMDLHARGRPDLAAHVISAWMEIADDHAAAVVLPIYEVYRAVVRAGVAAIRGSQHAEAALDDRAAVDRYLALAERLMVGSTPTLYATCGMSGSGKTTLAATVVGACGAVRLRSDVERKRIAGMRPTDRPADAETERALYGDAMSRRVYKRLADLAIGLLRAGTSVVVDATCARRWQREMLAAAARNAEAPLVWLECEVSLEEAVARVGVRRAGGGDASDATASVVRQQAAGRDPIADDELGPGSSVVRLTSADRAAPDLPHRLTLLAGGAPSP